MTTAFRLRLKRLDFISAVDAGAQGPISNVALLKRKPDEDFKAVCRVSKLDEKLGLVFGWALATSLDGGKTPHVDLQNDAITGDDDLIKVAAEFMESVAKSDVMHDGDTDGKIVFAMPLVPEINEALGITSDTHGLAIAMRPSAETFKRFQSGELAAFSIAGAGDREPIAEKRYLTKAESDESITEFIGPFIPAERGAARLTLNAPGKPSVKFEMNDAALAMLGSTDGAQRLAASMKRHTERWTNTKSTPTHPLNQGVHMTLDEALAKIADLTAELAKAKPAFLDDKDEEDKKKKEKDANKRLSQLTQMSGVHKTHFDTLTGDDAESFLSKSGVERTAHLDAVEKARTADPQFVLLAKRLEEQDQRIAKQDAELAKARDERNTEILKARVKSDVNHLSGTDLVKVAVLKALDGIADETTRTAAVAMLKGADAAMADFAKSKGASEGHDTVEKTLEQATESLAVKYAESHKVDIVKARAAVYDTAEYAALYAAHEVAKRNRNGASA